MICIYSKTSQTIKITFKGNKHMSLLSKIIYDVVQDFTGKPISEFNPDSIPHYLVDSVITKLITELNITPIIIEPKKLDFTSVQEHPQAFIGVNHTGTFIGVKVITINNLYSALIGNYPFWNIPNFGEMVKQLKIERTELKREFFVEKNHELKGKIIALKVFLNMLYWYVTSNNSKLTAFQDANWISNIGYNIMEQISKNPCVLYIDTDMIIATDIPVELSSISFLDYEVETKSVEIMSKKNLRFFEPKNDTSSLKSGIVKYNGNHFFSGEVVSGTVSNDNYLNVVEYDNIGNISRQGTVEISQFI